MFEAFKTLLSVFILAISKKRSNVCGHYSENTLGIYITATKSNVSTLF